MLKPQTFPLQRKALLSSAAAVLLSSAALAQTAMPAAAPPPAAWADQGFSYFLGIGRQDFRYRETGSILPFKSKASTSSPLLVTGALYAVNANVLFSMDSESTFYPGRSTETWSATAPIFNGVTLTSPTLQQNGFNLSQTNLQLLLHYRAHEDWFVVGGPAVRTQSFKRFSFVSGPDQAVNTPAGTTVEESTGELLLNLGVALESAQVRGKPAHYGVRALVGIPVWRRVENTSVPQLQFSGTKGYDLALEGRYSWAVLNGMHLGLWGKWTSSQRGRQVKSSTIELPDSRLDSLGYGAELLWKL